MRRALRGHLTKFLQIVRQSGFVNLIDSHASLQSLYSCKLNTVARVVELTYLHVIVKCKSLLGGHGKGRCTVKYISTHFYTFHCVTKSYPVGELNRSITLYELM